MVLAHRLLKKRSVRLTGLCTLCAVAGLVAGSISFPANSIAGGAKAGGVTVTVRPVAAEGEKKEAAKPAPGTGNLSGVVTLDGDIPKQQLLVMKGNAQVKDSAVCAAQDVPDESLVINPKNKGIANVFIFLAKPPAGYKAPPIPKDPVVFDQKGCRFLPHALIVRVNQNVLVKSGDDVSHNTHTLPVRSSTGFNQIITPNNREGTALKYDKPEKFPVEVKCDLHPWMKAYHFPVDHTFAAATNENGEFEIADLPPGKHEFVVWQEKVGYLDRKYTVDIKADKTTDVKLSYKPAKFAAK